LQEENERLIRREEELIKLWEDEGNGVVQTWEHEKGR